MLQPHVRVTDQAAAEPATLTHLWPAPAAAEDAGHLAHRHFARKADRRLRNQPTQAHDHHAQPGTIGRRMSEGRQIAVPTLSSGPLTVLVRSLAGKEL